MTNTIIEIRHGSRVVKYKIANPTDFIQKRLAQSRDFYERALLMDAASRLMPGDTCVDVGANIGNHTMFFAVVCGARVIAIEPNYANASLIAENASLNGVESHIDIRRVAVGQQDGRGSIEILDPANTGKARIKADGEGDLQIVTLDSLIPDDARPVKLLKVDVEGMELEALKGARRILETDRPYLYVEAGISKDFLAIQSYLADLGYAMTSRFNATATYAFESAQTEGDVNKILLRATAQIRNEMREFRFLINNLIDAMKRDRAT
ncbi:FkbM family methyltransferase [Chelativorans oligotrophicus]|uniref:FkbM family methyltransferase n=1 Tax=Chelativorans oligotrophicus TaxID=449974 RepID=UPI001409184A